MEKREPENRTEPNNNSQLMKPPDISIMWVAGSPDKNAKAPSPSKNQGPQPYLSATWIGATKIHTHKEPKELTIPKKKENRKYSAECAKN